MKRLAKLQSATTPGEPSSSSLPARPPKQPPPARVQPASQAPKRAIEHVATPQVTPKKKVPAKLNFEQWHHLTAGNIFNVTLDVWIPFLYRYHISYSDCIQRDEAVRSSYEVVWLKHLADELSAEGMCIPCADMRWLLMQSVQVYLIVFV